MPKDNLGKELNIGDIVRASLTYNFGEITNILEEERIEVSYLNSKVKEVDEAKYYEKLTQDRYDSCKQQLANSMSELHNAYEKMLGKK